MGRELEEFTERMEREGVKPEDLLKAILGEEVGGQVVDDVKKEKDRRADVAPPPPQDKAVKSEGKKADKDKSTSFEDTIRKTMQRMEHSDANATSATSQSATTAAGGSSSEEDILAQLLRAMETEGAGSGDSNDELSKMFLGMMEQLTNKDMLYEPMKELHTQFPGWLATHSATLAPADRARYTEQQRLVAEIVARFEQPGYSDTDPAARDYIWERMQRMQDQGAPPEDLVTNPFPSVGGMPGLGGLGGGGGGGGADGEDDVGCPTQ